MPADFTDKELKKRPKPEINERWWKDAWPGDKPPSGAKQMTTAIKAYKEAQRGTAQSALIEALADLDAAATKLKADAAGLKATPKRQKAILDDLAAFAGLVDAERRNAQKFGARTREVFRYNFAEAVTDILKKDAYGKRVKISGATATVELLEAIVQELDAKNLLNMLHKQYANARDTEAEKAADRIAELAKQRAISDDDQTVRMAQRIVDEHAAAMAEEIHKAPTTVIRKLGLSAAIEAQYQKELKKRRIDIVKATVLTAASGAAIALPGTQAFAIYGFVRSTANLCQQIVEHNISIQTASRILEEQLSYLNAVFKKAAGRAVSETGATTLNAILGVDIVPTLDKATSNFKTLRSNTDHAGVKLQKMTGEIMKMMDSCKDLDRTCKSLPKGHKLEKKLTENLARQEKELDKILDKAAKLAKMLNDVERRIPALERTLKGLGENSKAQKLANFSSKVLVNLTAIAGGGLVDATAAVTAAGAAVKGAQEIAALTIASTGYANELYNTAKELKEAATS